MRPTQEQALEGLLADQASPAKGDEQQAEAEPVGPSRPGDDAGMGNVIRNKKRVETRKRQKAAKRREAAEAAANTEQFETPEASATA
eukprot:11827102-Alexandrium_andersonii.AAC.1